MADAVSPAHRRAAAEALKRNHPSDTAQWIETGEWAEQVRALPCYPEAFDDYSRTAQAIADEGARAAAAERARLLANCKFFEVDFVGTFTEHDSLTDAENEAEAALDAAMDGDDGWEEGTEQIGYGALVYLGRAVVTSRSEAPEGSPFDEIVEYTLKTTDAPLGRELVPDEEARRDAEIAQRDELLRRIVKYAHEDRAATPGKTRLARALSEARKLLGIDEKARTNG